MTVQNVLMYFKSVFLTLLKHEIFFFSSIWEPGGDPGDPADVWGPDGRVWEWLGEGGAHCQSCLWSLEWFTCWTLAQHWLSPRMLSFCSGMLWFSVSTGFLLDGEQFTPGATSFLSQFKKSSWFSVCLALHCPAVRMLWQPLSSSYAWLEWESLPGSSKTFPGGEWSLWCPASSFVLILPLPADLPLLLLLD